MKSKSDNEKAALERENAELRRQLAESLAQQQATAEVLQVINASPGDLMPVFEAILEKAHRLCRATRGTLFLFDGETFHVAAIHGYERLLGRTVTASEDPRLGALLAGERFIHIRDLTELDDPIARAVAEHGGVRTTLLLPLRREGKLLGVLSCNRQKVDPFAEREIALLENFAAQAVIAIENARLITETRQALDQQTATAEVLQVINSSPGDLMPVFEAILEKAHTLCGAERGSLQLYDGEMVRAVATRETLGPLDTLLRQPHQPAPAFSRLLAGERFYQFADESGIDPLYSSSSAISAIAAKSGIRTLLFVPLRKDASLIGVISAARLQVKPFSEKEIALLENFAAQAVIAMENARLITETREALEQQTATAEVLGVINSSPGDLAPVFHAMLEKAMRLCEAARGILRTFDGEAFHVAAVYGDPDAAERFRRLGPSRFPRERKWDLVGRLLAGDRVVHVADVRESRDYREVPEVRARLDNDGARTALWVALHKDAALLGYFHVYRQEVRPFSDKQIALVQNFAAQAVIAMENARLITETREALEQQTATAEVLQVINSSPGDLAPVFEAVLAKAHELCGVETGSLQLYDGEKFRAVAVHGVAEPLAESMRQGYEPGTFNQPLLDGEAFVHFADLAKADHPMVRSGTDLGGIGTTLHVALRSDRVLLGKIVASRKTVRPFTDRQIALLRNFAAQAVIAMENARLITETREALDQQTATAEVLQVINASPGDLAPVFEAMLEKALELCDANFGYLLTYDGGGLVPVADRGNPAFSAWVRERGKIVPEPGTINARIIAGDSVVQVADVINDPFYQGDTAMRRAVVEIGEFRTVLTVALRKDELLLGVIHVYRQEVRPFSDRQIALLQNFAAQAVVAMENARLLDELRQRTADLQESLGYQTATSDVLKVISGSTFDVQPVFETISETATRLCDADFALFSRREGDAYRVVATFAFSPEFDAFIRGRLLPTGRGSLSSRVALAGEVVHIDDVAADPEYEVPETVTLAKARTVLGVPLLREGAVIGVIALARKRVQPFTERQIELVRTFADQAVIAIENARLLEELRQRTEEVAELNRGLEARVAEQVDELGRVGRLKRFLAPQLAELIVSQGDEKILESHRREIVVVFCDLRGYTAFTETAEPEEVLDFLREYHGALGPLVAEFEGTLDQFSGDGIMVFFNDPVPIPDPAERAVKMAMAMREAAGALTALWRRRGRELGFGAGIAQGYATLGQIGFSERSGYTAIGTVCNVAARLCAEAKDGQILIAQRVAAGLDGDIALEELGPLPLKGITQPVAAFNVASGGAGAGRLRLVEP